MTRRPAVFDDHVEVAATDQVTAHPGRTAHAPQPARMCHREMPGL